MAEVWDLYSRNREIIGKIKKGIEMPPGTYHLVVECVIVDLENNLLLTKRAPGKHHAGYWECTTGSVISGEDSLTGVMREVREETGLIIPERNFRRLCTKTGDHVIRDIYFVVYQKLNLSKVQSQDGETCDAMLMPFAFFNAFTSNEGVSPDGKPMAFMPGQFGRLKEIFGKIEERVDKLNGIAEKKIQEAKFEATSSFEIEKATAPKPKKENSKSVEFEEVEL